MKRLIGYISIFVILTGIGVLAYIRWDAWFGNPPETPWHQDTVSYHFYGFGEAQVPGFVYQGAYFQDTLSPDTLQFLLLGDVHNNVDSTQFRAIVQQHQPLDFYAQLGDFMERCHFSYYQLLLQQLQNSGLDSLPLLSTPGNHEYIKGVIRQLHPNWQKWFCNPQNGPERFVGSTYYVDFKGLRFIVIDTNGLQRLVDFTSTLTWLNRTMDEAKGKFIVVMMHHPVLSGAVGRQNLLIKGTFYHALQKADLVFSGHDHNYNRRLPFVGTNSAKKFYLSKINPKDTRICSGRQMYEILTLSHDTLTMQTYLMNSGKKYDEIKVYRDSLGQRVYIDNYVTQPEIIEIPEKYRQRTSQKVKHFWERRSRRLKVVEI